MTKVETHGDHEEDYVLQKFQEEKRGLIFKKSMCICDLLYKVSESL